MRKVFVLAVAFLFLSAAGVNAGDFGDPLPLDQRVAALEKRVSELERLVGVQPKAAAPIVSPFTTAVAWGTPTAAVQSFPVSPFFNATAQPTVVYSAPVFSDGGQGQTFAPFGAASVCGPNGCSAAPGGGFFQSFQPFGGRFRR